MTSGKLNIIEDRANNLKNNVNETSTKKATQAMTTILRKDVANFFEQKLSEFNFQKQPNRSKLGSPDGNGGDDSLSEGNSNNSKRKK